MFKYKKSLCVFDDKKKSNSDHTLSNMGKGLRLVILQAPLQFGLPAILLVESKTLCSSWDWEVFTMAGKMSYRSGN